MTLLAQPADVPYFLSQRVNERQTNLALRLASDVVRGYCGWRIDRATETLTVEATFAGSTLALLPTLHLEDVLSVHADGVPVEGFAFNTSGMLSGVGGSRIEVVAVHGYDPVPGDIEAVVLATAARVIVNPQGLRGVSIGGGDYAETYAVPASGEASNLTLLTAERRLLDRHRLFA